MKNKKKTKRYFDENEESAIRLYLKSENPVEKQILFDTYIHKAFDKLSENIINTYKFYGTGLEFVTLKEDVISFLVQKLDYFDPSKKKKAFSYFGTVAKNYLIQETRKKQKFFYYGDLDETQNKLLRSDSGGSKEENSEIIFLFRDAIAERIPKVKIANEKYAQFLQAMLLILQTYSTIEYLNKKYIKLYVETSSGLTEKQVNKYFNKSKKDFLNKIYKKYINDNL